MKKWREYTPEEVLKLKREQCSKCAYFSNIAGGADDMARSYCSYIFQNGHSRGCSPFECREIGIFKPKTGRRRKA